MLKYFLIGAALAATAAIINHFRPPTHHLKPFTQDQVNRRLYEIASRKGWHHIGE